MAKYWFRQRRFGFGVTPITWQGWAVCITPLAALPALSWATAHIAAGTLRVVATLGGFAIIVGAMLLVFNAKIEGKWRWRWNGRGR